MSTDTCIATPEAPNGEPSRLYRDLLKKLQDRPLVNWLYACYRTSIASQMGTPNAQGEHNMADFLKLVDYSAIEKDRYSLTKAELHLGAITATGQRVNYTNAEEAYSKADTFNDNHKGLVARVDRHGDIYNIIVTEKNSRNLTTAGRVKESLQAWNIYKQVFMAKGVDLTSLPQEVQSVINASYTDLGQYLKSLSKLSMDNTFKRDALILFSLSPNSKHIQNLINTFGSIESAAQAIDDFNHNKASLTQAEKTLLVRALRDAKNFSGVDIDALITQVTQDTKTLRQQDNEWTLKKEINDLNAKYGINRIELHKKSEAIKSLSEAAEEACVTLQRQIRDIEKKRGFNREDKELRRILDSMLQELNSKHYSFGVLQFLNKSASYINSITDMLEHLPEEKTPLETAVKTSSIIQKIKELHNQYYALLSALANESLIIDEAIDQVDIDNLRKIAKDLKKVFDDSAARVEDISKTNMIDIISEILPGKEGPNGETIANLVEMATQDSNYFDYLYAGSRHSNPLVASVGTIIRKAQDKRNEKMRDIDLRIRRATDRLYKKHSNSEFMYEEDGHIVSDIDWEAYSKAERQAIISFKRNGLKDFDLKLAIENWRRDNTEDRVVDTVNNRVERVPNSFYRKAYNFRQEWTKEQNEYYDTMMQIKGELGTLLPDYAQDHYLAPQIRRKFLDAINHAKNPGDIMKALKNWAKDKYTVREDDTNYGQNGIIDGQEFTSTYGDFDNTPKRQIPIFCINKVEQGELLKNFSTGLTAFAGTALNYEAMNSIKDTVEFMADYIEGQRGTWGKRREEVIANKDITLIKEIFKKSKNTKTLNILEGMISMYLYGEKRNPNENKALAKVMDNIIAYTSFKGLATNIKGAVANGLMGEFQMMIEAGCGQYYGWKDFGWAHLKLFGKAGATGEIMNLLTNNINSKCCLMRDVFDPTQDNFSNRRNHAYHKSMFRQLLSKDCSFIGYSSGEEVIHYVNMYAILHHEKVKLNGKEISLYDAYEVSNNIDNNSELVLKQGVTKKDGTAITEEYIQTIKNRIRGVNQKTHGAMNEEEKGIIHRRILGRCVMNFRQWMVEHYSRRFRGRYYDPAFGNYQEGYWYTLYKALINDATSDEFKAGHKLNAVGMFFKDLLNFTFRGMTHWENLTEDQKYNIKRVKTEVGMFFALCALDFMLGEPDEYKKDAWRRFCMYQVKRMIMDEEVAMPITPLQMLYNSWNMLQSPMACLNSCESLLYLAFGLLKGDVTDTIKTGKHKGENRYWRNVKKYVLPAYKDYEQMKNLATDDAIFIPFKLSLGKH